MIDPQAQAQARPRLLMLAHCLPEATGEAHRARAWQLLRLARHSHEVHLACLVGGPTHLSQWQAVHRESERLLLFPRMEPRRWAGALAGLVHGPTGGRITFGRELGAEVRTWSERAEYDAIVATHPMLCEQVGDLSARLKICDFYTPPSREQREAAGSAPASLRWWRRQLAEQHARVEQRVANQWDIVTLGDPDDLDIRVRGAVHPVVLPEAIDGPFFAEMLQAVQPRSRRPHLQPVVFHAHWADRHVRRTYDWFIRTIWPRVQAAVPRLQLVRSGVAGGPATMDLLRSASMVVAPVSEFTPSRWPMLQAMAMERPVIASGPALDDLGVRHAEHLLWPRREREWVDQCVEALRSASTRLELARGGRRFVDRNFQLDHAGRALMASLRTYHRDQPTAPRISLPLARAA